jgi:hypothetical protein
VSVVKEEMRNLEGRHVESSRFSDGCLHASMTIDVHLTPDAGCRWRLLARADLRGELRLQFIARFQLHSQ